jgi:hypothetical protein
MGSVDAQPWSFVGGVSFAGRGPFHGMRPRGKPRGLRRGSCANSLASSPPNPRADEDRDGTLNLWRKGDMIVGPWRISHVVLFKLFARTAELRESLF